MSTPTARHRACATHLLARDHDDENVEGRSQVPTATAMGIAYDQLLRAAGPLIGNAGVRAIFARSLKLTAAEHAPLRPVLLAAGYPGDPIKALHATLQGRDESAYESIVAALATFISLLERFIGERLTTQIIDAAWKPSEETKT